MCEHKWIEAFEGKPHCEKCNKFKWWVEASRLRRAYYRVGSFIWHIPPRLCVIHRVDDDKVYAVAYVWWRSRRVELARTPCPR